MTDFIAITRTHLKALIDAAQSDVPTPADAAIIVTAMQELESPAPTESPTSGYVRGCFELACKSSKEYRFPLGVMALNGVFLNYMDSDTDSAFVGYRAGFVRGLKWQHQITQVKATAVAPALARPVPLRAVQSQS